MNRLIIVGNGFDLAHGLKTKYSDFINWYWDGVRQKVTGTSSLFFKDTLCEIRPKYSSYFAPELSRQYDCSKDFIFALQKNSDFSVKISEFLLIISKSVYSKGWVDIEEEYYSLLKAIANDRSSKYYTNPNLLNTELSYIKDKLYEYLITIQDGCNISFINAIKKIFMQAFKWQDISVRDYNSLYQHLECRMRLSESELRNLLSVYDIPAAEKVYALSEEDLKSCSARERYPDVSKAPTLFLLPEKIMLLNFNYTNVADKYLREGTFFEIIHIHGCLRNPEKIIFGYGDELDDDYQNLLKKNDNRYLENVKSIRYLETDNYRKMLYFIESAPFQVYIMGHSCGNSDRTLLNTIFEHQNCVSIKPFYYRKDDRNDDYIQIVQNISRNFKDMTRMRDRVVNKQYCSPMPQLNDVE